jgi:very-short-patch-repair endonuclease
MIEQESHLTVGIITPFREQQQYLTKILFNDELAAGFEEQLDLKVMTFDTCQGEERDIIFYSLVATTTHDLLNYVFPVSLENTQERVEEMLKMQRLNVGFSRAKERIHFVLSKPIAQFSGSIGRVLTHYHQILVDQSLPENEDTDQASPMERQVLDWIKKTTFLQRDQERIELRAQFKLGDYLRQLDPTYHHPSYRVDFLLHYRAPEKTVNVIIEYDGFVEHFTDHHRVHEGNHESFYRPQDIERQMVLESYGYKFLRINRFNMGQDPVKTLSDRLTKLVGAAVQNHESNGVGEIKKNIEDIESGESKICQRCQNDLPPSIRPPIKFAHADMTRPANVGPRATRITLDRGLRWYACKRSTSGSSPAPNKSCGAS